MSKFKVFPFEKVRVTKEIERERPEDVRRGPLDTPRPEILARRRTTQTTHPPVMVYDLGRLASGADAQHVYRSTMADTSTGAINPVSELLPTWNADILASYTTWHTTYRNITANLDDYGIKLLNFDNYTPGDGVWSSTDEQNLQIFNTEVWSQNQYFPTRWNQLNRGYKITSTTTPTDPAATYTHDKPADLFVSPMFMINDAFALSDENNPLRDAHLVLKQMSPIPRNATLLDATWETVWTNRYSTGSLSAAEIAFWRGIMFDNYAPAMWESIQVNSSVPFAYVLGDIANFPTDGDHVLGDWITRPNATMSPGFYQTNHLVGAIRKHLTPSTFEWYFIWADEIWSTLQANHLEDVVV
jgi:hypothetical protein